MTPLFHICHKIKKKFICTDRRTFLFFRCTITQNVWADNHFFSYFLLFNMGPLAPCSIVTVLTLLFSFAQFTVRWPPIPFGSADKWTTDRVKSKPPYSNGSTIHHYTRIKQNVCRDDI